MARQRILLVIVGVILATLGLAARATLPPPRPTLGSLSGVWIGPGDQGTYYRLELNAKGHGLLVVQELWSGPISFYKVAAVKLVGYNCDFDLAPQHGANPTVRLKGICNGDLHLVRSGINRDNGFKWQDGATLERANLLLPRIRAVREASERFHAEH